VLLATTVAVSWIAMRASARAQVQE